MFDAVVVNDFDNATYLRHVELSWLNLVSLHEPERPLFQVKVHQDARDCLPLGEASMILMHGIYEQHN